MIRKKKKIKNSWPKAAFCSFARQINLGGIKKKKRKKEKEKQILANRNPSSWFTWGANEQMDRIEELKIKRGTHNGPWQVHSVKVVPSQRRFYPRKSSSRERNVPPLPTAACSDRYRRKLKIPRWSWWLRCYFSCNPEVLSAGPRPSTIGRRSSLLDFQ